MRARTALILLAALGAAAPLVEGANFQVLIQGFAFEPAQIHIRAGDDVTWRNDQTGTLHSIVSDGGRFAGSGALSTGETHTASFSHAGVYDYFCGFHDWMGGQVRVTEPQPPNAPPVLTVTHPAPGTVVAGVVRIAGHVSDPEKQPVVVDVQVDSTGWTRTSGFPDWFLQWDTRAMSNGTHVLKFRASDGGPFVEAPPRNVTVANPGTPAPASRMILSDLRSPMESRVGTEVEISVLLRNTGDARGSGIARFFLDGVQKAARTATLEGGGATRLTVALVIDEPGTHAVGASLEGHPPLGPRLMVVDPAVDDGYGGNDIRPPPPPNHIPLPPALTVLALAAAARTARRS